MWTKVYQILDNNDYSGLSSFSQKEQEEIICETLKYRSESLEAIKDLHTEEFLVRALTISPFSLRYVKDEFQANLNVLFAACKKNERAFANAALEQVKRDRKIILALCERHPEVVRYTPFKEDLDFIKEAVEKNPDIIRYVYTRVHIPKEVFLQALLEEPSFVAFLPLEWRENKETVLDFAKSCGRITEVMSFELKMDPDFIIQLLAVNKTCLEFLHPEARLIHFRNRAFVEQAVRIQPSAVQYYLEYDRDLLEQALRKNPYALFSKKIVTPHPLLAKLKTLEGDISFSYTVILQIDGLALRYIPEDSKTFELCQIAVNEDRRAIEYIPTKFHKDLVIPEEEDDKDDEEA